MTAMVNSAGPLVSVRNLRVSFRLDKYTTFDAIKGISFDIPRQKPLGSPAR